MMNVQLRAMRNRMDKLPIEYQERLLSFLPSEKRQAYITLLPTQTLFSRPFTLEEVLRRIHPSWYEDTLNSYEEPDRSLLNSALAKDEASYVLPKKLKDYLLHEFFMKAFPKDHCPAPVTMLPEDSMLPLLQRDYKMIGKLCQYLGLFDLLQELKTIIQKDRLRLVEEALEPEELTFLNEVKNEGVRMPPMGLNQYDGKHDVLRRVLFERGLFRLAKCVSESDEGLRWYVLHMIETRHVQMYKGWCTPIHDVNKSVQIKEELLNTWTYLCNAFPS